MISTMSPRANSPSARDDAPRQQRRATAQCLRRTVVDPDRPPGAAAHGAASTCAPASACLRCEQTRAAQRVRARADRPRLASRAVEQDGLDAGVRGLARRLQLGAHAAGTRRSSGAAGHGQHVRGDSRRPHRSARASGSRRGWALYRPSTSVAISSRSASTSAATIAARLSLSPSLSSSTATVSFSLTTGSAPRRSSSIRVLRAFR